MYIETNLVENRNIDNYDFNHKTVAKNFKLCLDESSFTLKGDKLILDETNFTGLPCFKDEVEITSLGNKIYYLKNCSFDRDLVITGDSINKPKLILENVSFEGNITIHCVDIVLLNVRYVNQLYIVGEEDDFSNYSMGTIMLVNSSVKEFEDVNCINLIFEVYSYHDGKVFYDYVNYGSDNYHNCTAKSLNKIKENNTYVDQYRKQHL